MKLFFTLLFTILCTTCLAQLHIVSYDLLYQDSVVMLENCKIDTVFEKPEILYGRIVFQNLGMKIISDYNSNKESWTAYGHSNNQLYAIRYREFPYTLWLTPVPFNEKNYFYSKGYIITEDETIKCPN